MFEAIKEITLGSLDAIISLSIIVMPMMILLQLGRDYKILEKILYYVTPLSRLLGVSKKARLPLVIGLIFGLAYGAGVIVQCAKEDGLSMKDRFLIVLFLVACHAVIEDTVVFVAVGADGWFLLTARLGVAVIFTAIASRCMSDRAISLITSTPKDEQHTQCAH